MGLGCDGFDGNKCLIEEFYVVDDIQVANKINCLLSNTICQDGGHLRVRTLYAKPYDVCIRQDRNEGTISSKLDRVYTQQIQGIGDDLMTIENFGIRGNNGSFIQCFQAVDQVPAFNVLNIWAHNKPGNRFIGGCRKIIGIYREKLTATRAAIRISHQPRLIILR